MLRYSLEPYIITTISCITAITSETGSTHQDYALLRTRIYLPLFVTPTRKPAWMTAAFYTLGSDAQRPVDPLPTRSAI